MKAKLEFTFDLHDEGDKASYHCLMEAQNLVFSIQDFDEFLRHKLKYEELSDAEHEIYDEIRSKLWETINSRIEDFTKLEY